MTSLGGHCDITSWHVVMWTYIFEAEVGDIFHRIFTVTKILQLDEQVPGGVEGGER